MTGSSIYAGLGDILTSGFDIDLASSDHMIRVSLDQIEIVAQVREELEDEDNTLQELGDSLRKRQLQAILLRPIKGQKPYRLVCGERRFRAARLVGLDSLLAIVVEMTDDDAQEFQLAENIHRKNLTQIEEARQLQRDLDFCGSVDAVLKKHNKSKGWLSKKLSLLNLPNETKRLVDQKISADMEVINTVKQVEKINTNAARELVNKLKSERGSNSARKIASDVKSIVKPNKKNKHAEGKNNQIKSNFPQTIDLDNDNATDIGISIARILDDIYNSLSEERESHSQILKDLGNHQAEVLAWLRTHQQAGRESTNLGEEVLAGFRAGRFASVGAGAFALAAYLSGAETADGVDIDFVNLMKNVG
jgi:ParB family transcriptional regulator, chromosome partitioning protein